MFSLHEYRDLVVKSLGDEIASKTQQLINNCINGMHPTVSLAGEIRGIKNSIDLMNLQINKIYGDNK